MRQKIHQQIDQLLPNQLNLISEFLGCLQFQQQIKATQRQAGLHTNIFQITDDFDDSLPDSFWLGKE